jgi:hypothetical protein
MLLSWFEDDVTSERTDHSSFADAAAVAACLVAALLAHHHAPADRSTLYSAMKTPHASASHRPAHSRRA